MNLGSSEDHTANIKMKPSILRQIFHFKELENSLKSVI
jgi:hypothetical protein